MTIIVPSTEAELTAHYESRYETLRLPWGQPPGSEREGLENDNILASAINNSGQVIGVARMLPLGTDAVQIRSMGVSNRARGQGVGKALLAFLETKARNRGIIRIVLQARENAVHFYQAAGYTVLEESYLLWGVIQHYKMEKWLKLSTEYNS